jgi:ABC-2 type transport system ATP-binding protein
VTHAVTVDRPEASASSAVAAGGVDTAITADALVKKFGKRVAVDGVTLHIAAGQTVGLVGLNGAGKSTLLRMLVGLCAPTSGKARLRGVNVASDAMRARMGVAFVPDKPHAFPWMRVREVIGLCATMQPSWQGATAARLMKQYGIDPTQRVGKLSKGTGAKLSLLLALAQDPDVLILDEPTDGLDPIARDEFVEEVIGAVHDRGGREPRTIVISSHALDELEKIVDSVAMMHEGRLVMHEPAEVLLKRTKRIRAIVEDGVTLKPSGCVFTKREGRSVIWTVRDFDERVVADIRAIRGVRDVEVMDMRLADIFKDTVRGLQASRGTEGGAQ